jgi:hypothetical protein
LTETGTKDCESFFSKQQKQLSMIKRQKKHPFANDTNPATNVRNNDQVYDEMEPQSMPDTAQDLCKMKNLCQHFKHHTCSSQSEERCLGFLQSEKLFRHFLFSTTTKRPKPAGIAQQAPVSLNDVVQGAKHSFISVPQQLQIAHKLALAVLQYQSTPWLRSEWELGDLGLFLNDGDITDSTIATLHLSANFPSQMPNCSPKQIASDADSGIPIHHEADSTKTIEPCSTRNRNIDDPQMHQALFYGVDNMTLCSLGIALLQIGYRQPLHELRREHEPNNLYTARRLAIGANPLGPKFQGIIQKCLRCDFGSGTDLESPELQGAVFNDVACELEGMLAKLTL